ncbi:MAG: hypothetical protein JNL08_19370 [Planctomycetes bacterium]|nr:hypothetical protein [Planctomycetota bacterium]
MTAASLFAQPMGWPQALAWAEAHVAAWRAADRECPVLDGATVPGSSYQGYAAAVALLGRVGALDPTRLTEVAEAMGTQQVLAPADQELLRRLEPALAALREAAHRSGGPGSWPGPETTGDDVPWLDVLPLVDGLRLAAREHARAGRHEAARQTLLDGLAVGADLAHGIVPVCARIGDVIVERMLGEFDEAWLAAAGDEPLARLAAALAAVDAALPLVHDPLGDAAATFVLALARRERWTAGDLGLPSALIAWRHGFSVRHYGMSLATQEVEAAIAFAAATPAAEPWPQRRARLAVVAAASRRARIGAWPGFAEHVVEAEEHRREVVARLRLLRLAVDWHRGVRSEPLADPFGDGPLTAVPTAAGVVFASERPGLQRGAFAAR